jgi:hypothetical protein
MNESSTCDCSVASCSSSNRRAAARFDREQQAIGLGEVPECIPECRINVRDEPDRSCGVSAGVCWRSLRPCKRLGFFLAA